MSKKTLTLELLKDKYSVCKLSPTAQIPKWSESGDFFSVTRTAEELSIVSLETNVPNDVNCEKDWRIFKVRGPLDFSLIGILSSISSILAQSGISIFAISTYNTDYILVKDEKVAAAIKALTNENYEIIS